MVPVGVAHQDVGFPLAPSRVTLHQSPTQFLYARAGVEDETLVTGRHLHAGCIAANGALLKDRKGMEIGPGGFGSGEVTAPG